MRQYSCRRQRNRLTAVASKDKNSSRSRSSRKMSFLSLPREVMCQKAPSNSSLNGLDMPPRIPRRQQTRQTPLNRPRMFPFEEVGGHFDTQRGVAIPMGEKQRLSLLRLKRKQEA